MYNTDGMELEDELQAPGRALFAAGVLLALGLTALAVHTYDHLSGHYENQATQAEPDGGSQGNASDIKDYRSQE